MADKAFVYSSRFLFLMIITNDFHELAFNFPMHDFSPDNYRHGIGYFLVFGWFALCSFASFAVMCTGGKIRRKPGAYAPLIISLVLTVYYIITCLVGNKVTMFFAGDLSAACSLLFAFVLESCIYCGLLPTNTRYDEMFVASVDNSAQIVDENFNVCYASACAQTVSEQQIRSALTSPVAVGEDVLLHTAAISGGYTVWTEDISVLNELRKELTETGEELQERSAMLKHEYVLEKERKITAEQNRLYDFLTASAQKQIDAIAALMKEYELACDDSEKRNAVLSKIAVLGGYVKRKKHLILSSQNSNDILCSELKNAIDESVRYLKAMGVRCVVYVDNPNELLPYKTVSLAYDFFESVIEAALESIASCVVSVSEIDGILRMRIVVTCNENLSSLKAVWNEALIEASDENEWELILPLRGGDAL